MASVGSERLIQTVSGKISPDMLGFCHSHEHILLAKGKGYEISKALCMEDLQKSLDELILFKAAGGRSIVDAQPVGCGRMSEGLAMISEKSGVNIIASTGFHKMIFYYDSHWIFSYSEEQLAEIFINELETGMYTNADNSTPDKTHVSKAGIIKTALDTVNLDAQYTKLFSAAAKASVKTGAPLMIHIEGGSDPVLLDDFLNSRGVLPQKRIYCHLDRAVPDLKVHKELCRRGCYLEYDTVNRLKYHSNESEIAIIKEMLSSGFEKQILIGLDTTNERLSSYGGNMGLDYIKTKFIPMAAESGIPQSAFESMMTTNPREAFAV